MVVPFGFTQNRLHITWVKAMASTFQHKFRQKLTTLTSCAQNIAPCWPGSRRGWLSTQYRVIAPQQPSESLVESRDYCLWPVPKAALPVKKKKKESTALQISDPKTGCIYPRRMPKGTRLVRKIGDPTGSVLSTISQ